MTRATVARHAYETRGTTMMINHLPKSLRTLICAGGGTNAPSLGIVVGCSRPSGALAGASADASCDCASLNHGASLPTGAGISVVSGCWLVGSGSGFQFAGGGGAV